MTATKSWPVAPSILDYEPGRPWAEIGAALDQVEKEKAWETAAGSFSSWLQQLAVQLGLKKASLWRYLSAVRFYEQLRAELADRNIDLPLREALPTSVSAENIELLAKLYRVLDKNEADTLVQRTLKGTVTRDELRHHWQAYRLALGGRTARGIGALVPSVDPTDSGSAHSILRAKLLSSIRNGGAGWTGISDPDLFKIFPKVESWFYDRSIKAETRIDITILMRPKADAEFEFHGLVVVDRDLQHRHVLAVDKFAPFYNRLWIATVPTYTKADELLLPESVGLLFLVNDRIEAVKRAHPSVVSDLNSGLMAKSLLAELLRH